ncbi:MAG: hypothetical protein RL522_94 [Pseudomonadota bacterium]
MSAAGRPEDANPPAAPRRWLHWVVGAACAVVVSGSGGALTHIGPWYRNLVKPWFQPPDWLFGPAWTLIFALCVVAGVGAWRAAPDARQRMQLILLFALNGVFNVLWSLLFFHLRRPDWALMEIGFLWLSILLLIWLPGRYHPRIRLLLLPYLAWVSFASVLNAAVVGLNGPF